MTGEHFRLSYPACLDVLASRLAEPAPSRVQLLSGPRQVGKTTLLLELAARAPARAIYVAADAPEASLPGAWERAWARAEAVARESPPAVILLDEIHLFPAWSARLKGAWDSVRRRKVGLHVVASGSSSLALAAGSRESLAGRFERLTLTHWSAASLAHAFPVSEAECVDLAVRMGTYPGAFALRADVPRWLAYVRDAILEPAIGRDILALAPVRRPALLRQVFGVAVASPAQVVSLQKIQSHLQDPGALATIAHYMGLLEEAFLVAAIPKFSVQARRQRAAPPKLVTLNNAFLAATAPESLTTGLDAARLGAWVENACLAHAWNAGQRVRYWREEPFEVDGVIEGSWGSWALEVKTGAFSARDLAGLFEFTRRHPAFKPLVVTQPSSLPIAESAGAQAVSWQDFLLRAPPA